MLLLGWIGVVEMVCIFAGVAALAEAVEREEANGGEDEHAEGDGDGNGCGAGWFGGGGGVAAARSVGGYGNVDGGGGE